MSATVVHMSKFRQRGTDLARRLVPAAPVSDADFVRQHIRDQLHPHCPMLRIAQAVARAERRIAQGCPADRAIRYAIAWATCADPDRDPPTPQAA